MVNGRYTIIHTIHWLWLWLWLWSITPPNTMNTREFLHTMSVLQYGCDVMWWYSQQCWMFVSMHCLSSSPACFRESISIQSVSNSILYLYTHTATGTATVTQCCMLDREFFVLFFPFLSWSFPAPLLLYSHSSCYCCCYCFYFVDEPTVSIVGVVVDVDVDGVDDKY